MLNRLKNLYRRFKSSRRDVQYVDPFDHMPSFDDIKSPPHKGERVRAYVNEVYDGDTFVVLIFINDNPEAPFQFRCRVNGVDTPEVRTKNQLHKEAGLKVRDYVKDKIEKSVIEVEILKWNTYGGRIDCNVFIPYENEEGRFLSLAEHLIHMKYGLPSVDKRRDWSDEELIYILNH